MTLFIVLGTNHTRSPDFVEF